MTKYEMQRRIRNRAKAVDFKRYMNPVDEIEVNVSNRLIEFIVANVAECNGDRFDAMSAIAHKADDAATQLAAHGFGEVGQTEVLYPFGRMIVAVNDGGIYADTLEFFPFE